jgi:hypothetical protein
MATLPTSQARELLHVLGFVACSIEFFTQEAGHEPGVGVKMIDGLEDAMSALSVSAMLPPNLGLHGYWLANPEAQPLSFTSNPGEAFFRAGVVRINLLHELCVGMLSPLGSGEIPLDAPEAAGALRAAAELQNRVHEVYDTFRDENNITIEFFRSVMRRFLVKFPVHGVEFHSANAANICSQAKLDFVIGTTADFYISHVAERMRYMTPEERSELIERMRAPSILDQVLRRLGITAAEVTAPEAVQRVVGKHPELRSALLGFRQLERAAGGAAGAHFGLISRFLIKPDLDDGLSSVKASHGTGGRSHEETKAVATMRNRHEIARPLSDAIRVVFMHAGTDAA